MEKIGRWQLFALVMMEQIGSTGLWVLGIDAKRDAWLVILFSMLVGCAFIWVFTELQKQFPRDNIAGLVTKLLGTILGWPLVLLYAAVDTFNATRNTSEFTDLLNVTFLQHTPAKVIMFLFLATVIYISFMGVEAFVRLTEIVLFLCLIAITVFYILIITSGKIDLRQLLPVLENGPVPVLKAAFPLVVNFPFALAFIFMQFWHYCEFQTSVRKITYSGVILSGSLLTITQIITIAIIGVPHASTSTIPVLEVLKLTSINEMLVNPDVLAILNIFVGGFYMTIIHILSAAMILAGLFRIKDYRWILVLLTAFIFWYSGVYEPNYPFHVRFLPVQSWQQFVPLYNAAPILLLIIYWLKKYCRKPVKKRAGRHFREEI